MEKRLLGSCRTEICVDLEGQNEIRINVWPKINGIFGGVIVVKVNSIQVRQGLLLFQQLQLTVVDVFSFGNFAGMLDIFIFDFISFYLTKHVCT